MNTKQLNSVVGYARISTERHLADADVLLSAQQCLKEYGVSSDLFFWDMESGFTDKRRGYDDILAFITQGNVQKVVVYCFDYFRGNTL
jgi:site-specific DNA recombinase